MTRRDAMKTALKGAAYVAPVVLATRIPAGVAAAPGPTADVFVAGFVSVTPGSANLTRTAIVGDSGPSVATGVVASNPVPAGFTLAGATPAQGTYNSGTGCGRSAPWRLVRRRP